MSSAFYGFLTKTGFIKNPDNEISTFFELSPLALTYSRNRQEHQHPSYPGDILHTFYNKQDGSTESVVPSSDIVAEIMAVVNATYVYFQDNPGTGTVEGLTHYINSLYPDNILSFMAGEIASSQTLQMSGWVSWVSVQNNDAAIRVWMNNEAFENQYPSHEIVVIQPLEAVSLNKEYFQNQYSRVITEIGKVTITRFSEIVEEARNEVPPTFTRYLEFGFTNKENNQQSTSTTWGILIYGRDGDNIDSIKDAIADLLLANSAYSQAQWELVFPEIFRRTEFLIFPRWDKVSISNTNELSSLYSSILGASETANFVKTNYPGVTPSDFTNRVEIIPFDYKGVSCGVAPGLTNDSDRDQLYELFQDYLPMPTTSPDFARMSIETRTWALGIVNGLITAETATEYSGIANPYRKTYRQGKLFISFHYKNVNYLIAARSNLFYDTGANEGAF